MHTLSNGPLPMAYPSLPRASSFYLGRAEGRARQIEPSHGARALAEAADVAREAPLASAPERADEGAS
jgi:hypothetical protein